MNILEKHDIKLDSQGLAELAHMLDFICDNCSHRWGEVVNGNKVRSSCIGCRLLKKPIQFDEKPKSDCE